METAVSKLTEPSRCLKSLTKGSKNQYLFIQQKQANSYVSDLVYFNNEHDENIV